jgi:hypothetical protein
MRTCVCVCVCVCVCACVCRYVGQEGGGGGGGWFARAHLGAAVLDDAFEELVCINICAVSAPWRASGRARAHARAYDTRAVALLTGGKGQEASMKHRVGLQGREQMD